MATMNFMSGFFEAFPKFKDDDDIYEAAWRRESHRWRERVRLSQAAYYSATHAAMVRPHTVTGVEVQYIVLLCNKGFGIAFLHSVQCCIIISYAEKGNILFWVLHAAHPTMHFRHNTATSYIAFMAQHHIMVVQCTKVGRDHIQLHRQLGTWELSAWHPPSPPSPHHPSLHQTSPCHPPPLPVVTTEWRAA